MRTIPSALLLVSVFAVFPQTQARAADVASPDGRLILELRIEHGQPTWAVSAFDQPILKHSQLGVRVAETPVRSVREAGFVSREVREHVELPWGKCSAYQTDYTEALWSLETAPESKRTINLRARVYDSGVAIRYEFPVDEGWAGGAYLEGDATEFRFADDYRSWSYRHERDPLGPAPLSKVHQLGGAKLPLTLRCSENLYATVLESSIVSTAPFELAAIPNEPYAFRAAFDPSVLKPGEATSWRTIIVGREPGELLTSPLPYCLNPPSAIEDPEWVQPGLALWDWRAWGARTQDGFEYGLDMASWRRFVDFASRHNIRYLVLDANWYGPEFDPASDPRTSRDHLVTQTHADKPEIVRAPPPKDWSDPIDVPGLISYARQRGVGIILYLNDVARLNYPFEETLALYESWGAAGIKYGFMRGKGQQKVRDTREIVRLCAEHHLICDFHDGPVPPSGDERTYPNYLTREFCHAQSDSLRAFSPTGFCKTVFVNMVAGPLDMNNGLFTLENPAAERPRIFTNVESTVVAECARVLITFSGLAILPDCPEAYEKKADLFAFISRQPMTWDETHVLHGQIGECISTARRKDAVWFIGSVTNEAPRTLELDLSFLPPDQAFVATLYEDANDSHYQLNREAYRIRKREVTRKDKIDARMAPGGGHCVLLEPK